MGALTAMADYLEGNVPIVVLLPSAETDLVPGVKRRHLEYGDLSQPFAVAHTDLVANTVKALVDSHFSTYTSSQDNFLIGSSLGGQAAMNILVRHSDKFGGAACLSPYFGPTILSEVSKCTGALHSKRIYMDIGGDIDATRVPVLDLLDHVTTTNWWNPGYWWLDTQLQPAVRSMKRAILSSSSPHDKNAAAATKLAYTEVPGARHNERAWSLRIDKPVLHLFGRARTSSR